MGKGRSYIHRREGEVALCLEHLCKHRPIVLVSWSLCIKELWGNIIVVRVQGHCKLFQSVSNGNDVVCATRMDSEKTRAIACNITDELL